MQAWRSLWSRLTRVSPMFWAAATALVVGSALLVWLPRATTDTDALRIAQAMTPLALMPFWLAGLRRLKAAARAPATGVNGFYPLLLLCPSLPLAGVAAAFSIYASHPLTSLAPAPGWSEGVRLGAQSLLLACMLTLPIYGPAQLARLRLLIEGLLATLTVVLCGWLWLGPPLLHGLRVAREAT